MPSWWSRKSKSKPRPDGAAASCSSSPRTKPEPEEDDEGRNPARGRESRLKGSSKKEKANSFDEAVARRAAARDASPAGGGGGWQGPLLASGHPLPRPVSSPLPSIPHDIAAAGPSSASASASSASSSGSDETPDLAYRYADPVNAPRGRNMTYDSRGQYHVAEDKYVVMPSSPRKEFYSFGCEAPAHQHASMENIFDTANCSRGNTLPTSPIHPKALGICPGSPRFRQDDMKSPHPLPLPPSSPGSSSCSHSVSAQWKRGKLLGRGTFGHVYLGFNSESGQMCAIKEVKVISDDASSKESLRQLNQEISLLRQLSHPNIVQYYGSDLVDDTLSVYLEYVSGGSIHKLLQEYGPFREPVIRSYTRQILSGIAYLHGKNTLHRDIKGANILVDPNGEVKLADFGMAKHISAYTSIRSFKGSPYWMAPEVIMNANGYNLSVDIWSLGCTILEMATSKPPWSHYEGVAAIFKIGNSKDIPDIPEHLSADAKGFLKLCLQRDPAARPTATELLGHAFVQDEPLIKATKSSLFRDTLPSLSAGTLRPASVVHSPNQSVSPLRDGDYGVPHFVEYSSAPRNQSDRGGRMNMSLPVSPCSSPLRQYRQSNNRSCLPSPPHPAYSAGAIGYSPSNYSLYPTRPSSNFDPWPDIPRLKVPTPYSSPRRR